jgi:hypothetical protein
MNTRPPRDGASERSASILAAAWLLATSAPLGCSLGCSRGDAEGGTGGGPSGPGSGGHAAADGQAAGGAAAAGGSPSSGGQAAGIGGSLGGETSTGGAGPVDLQGDACRFSVAHELSSEITTVGIVSWSSDFPNPTSARLEFGPTGSLLDRIAPAQVPAPLSRTLLLGMKGEAAYSFRIVVESAAGSCKSPELDLITGAVPDWVPTITKVGDDASAAVGFIVTSPGVGPIGPRDGLPSAYIFDTDGDVVWWYPELVTPICRAALSWDGQAMWVVNAYGASAFSMSMDGLTLQEHALEGGVDHDLVALPDGGMAAIASGTGVDALHSVVEFRPEGTIELIVEDLGTIMDAQHPNALHYYQADDSFTLSDLLGTAFVKFTHGGELVWKLDGNNPEDSSFELVGAEAWETNHGHHLLPDGSFLFFNNVHDVGSQYPASRVVLLELDEESWTAEQSWQYVREPLRQSEQLGDVERLPNGNVLVTYSNMSLIEEVTPGGDVLKAYGQTDASGATSGSFGYATFRPSLYGPPPR